MLQTQPVGNLLREWRKRRRLSQLDLACEADISTRHLSFVETGRSQPSRDMVLHLAERLDIPLRERNILLIAAGYAPVFSERSLEDPLLHPARKIIDMALAVHEPFPALAIDRHWTLLAANRAIKPFMKASDKALLTPPINVLRLSLHPSGLASRIANFSEWRTHILTRLRHQIDVSSDLVLVDLLHELSGYPIANSAVVENLSLTHDISGIAIPLQFITDDGVLSFLSTTTVFGTPVEITLSEIAIESFFPADTRTADICRQLAAHQD
ncbi:MAG: helix-turn-helix transcriptional regulator [Acidobacteriota bacterium]